MPPRKIDENRIQSWAPEENNDMKPAPTAGFRFYESNSDKTVPKKFVQYRPAVLKKIKGRCYVEYWFRIPDELAHKHKEKGWKRFRVFENVNRYKSDEYANELVLAVNKRLDAGFNPFYKTAKAAPKVSDYSLNKGLDEFLLHAKNKGLRIKSLQTYGTTVNQMKEFFVADNKLYLPVGSITKQDIRNMMQAIAAKRKWSATTYNKFLGAVRIVFNWFVKEEKLDKSPCKGVEERNAVVTKHAYLDDKTADKLKKEIDKVDPYLNKFIAFVYYTATRPKSETRMLKIDNIDFERELLQIPGNISKNKKTEFIPLAAECLDLLKSMQIEKFPKSYFIFNNSGKPAKDPAPANYFALQFQIIRDDLKLSKDFTIYGFKHLRAIHLAQDGANHYDIMRLFRHSSLEMTQKYLRDLGLTDFNEVLKKGRSY